MSAQRQKHIDLLRKDCASRFLSVATAIRVLKADGALQSFDFDLRERSELARSQKTEGDRSDPHADQLLDKIPQGFEDATNFAIAPLVKFNLHPSIFFQFLQYAGPRRSCWPVLLANAFAQERKFIGRRTGTQFYLINFLHAEAWMGEPSGQFAVIGQQQKSGGVVVQSAHRKNSLFGPQVF